MLRKRKSTMARYERVLATAVHFRTQKEVAKELGLSKQTVNRLLRRSRLLRYEFAERAIHA